MGTSEMLFPELAGRRILKERGDVGQFVIFSQCFFFFPRGTQKSRTVHLIHTCATFMNAMVTSAEGALSLGRLRDRKVAKQKGRYQRAKEWY